MVRAELDGYVERHHIIPVCLGGEDVDSNLVRLTPEEHYVAHQLLTKIYPNDYGLAKAAAMMTINRPGNKMYGWVKRKFAKAQSVAQRGKKNSQYGTKWVYSLVLEETKRIPIDSEIEEGWFLGRITDFSKFRDMAEKYGKSVEEIKQIYDRSKSFSRVEKTLEFEIEESGRIARWKELMYYYRDNDISLRQLSKKFDIGQNAYVQFERYFKEEYREIVRNKPNNSNVSKGRY